MLIGYVSRPLPDDHPFHPLIGRVAFESGHLEHALDETIWALSQMRPQDAALMTAKMKNYVLRFEKIALLAEQSDISKDVRKDYDELKTEYADVAELRARIIHDAWFMYMGEQIRDEATGLITAGNTGQKRH